MGKVYYTEQKTKKKKTEKRFGICSYSICLELDDCFDYYKFRICDHSLPK